MAKIITDKELLQVISQIVIGYEVSSHDTYQEFLQELAGAVTTAMGGEVGTVSYADDPIDEMGTPIGWTIAFKKNRWEIEEDETPPLQHLLDELKLDPEGEL
jgi:hypothetical protein